jgi:hypothetical protein
MYSITCTSPPLNQPCGVIPAATMGLDCNGTPRPEVGPITADTSVYVCATGLIPNLPLGYEMALFDGCCTDCEQYTITIIPGIMPSELNGSSIYYIDCATKELIRIDLTGSVSYTLTACMVTGSINLYLTPYVSSIITQGIPCP